MKLGVFDSGLGGLLIARAIRETLPDVDMVYFGDTLHLPYGNRSVEAIYAYSRNAMDFLFAQDCQLVVTACNTVSASALRPLQQVYLPARSRIAAFWALWCRLWNVVWTGGTRTLALSRHIISCARGFTRRSLRSWTRRLRFISRLRPCLCP